RGQHPPLRGELAGIRSHPDVDRLAAVRPVQGAPRVRPGGRDGAARQVLPDRLRGELEADVRAPTLRGARRVRRPRTRLARAAAGGRTGVVGRDGASAGSMLVASRTGGWCSCGGPCRAPPPAASAPAAAAPASTARNRTMPPVPASRPPGPYGFVGRSPTR